MMFLGYDGVVKKSQAWFGTSSIIFCGDNWDMAPSLYEFYLQVEM